MQAGTLVVIAAAALASASVQVRPSRDYTQYNVCEVIPADTIRRAVGDVALVSARPTFDKKWSRCAYAFTTGAPNKNQLYTVWLSPAADFEEMKAYIDEKITAVARLGDGAYIYQDRGDGRFKLYVLMRGDQTIQATGDSPDSARKVAEAVLAILRKKPA
jgi:hypothetical protein